MTQAVEVVTASTPGMSLFAEDDYETWCIMSRGEGGLPMKDESQGQQQLQQRLASDHSGSQSYWRLLTTTASSLGFEVQTNTTDNTLTTRSGNNNNNNNQTSLPVAFETTAGRNHLSALCQMLEIDQTTAVQLTFGSLPDTNSSDSQQQFKKQENNIHLQSLLGTKSLLLSVLQYASKQRLARLGIVTELLRLDQQQSPLSRLNQSVILNQMGRGVLQLLLHVACAPAVPPTRNQLLALKPITGDNDAPYVAQVLQHLSLARMEEREQAMEALLALCYNNHTMPGTIRVIDYCILVLALQSQESFFTALPATSTSTKLACMAGLLCAEAAQLRAPSPSHTMTTSSSSEEEWHLLENVVMNYATQVQERRSKGNLAAPESIAMLVIGLLGPSRTTTTPEQPNMNTDGSASSSSSSSAMACLELANDCGAFEYLQATLDHLLPNSTSAVAPFQSYQGKLHYDWQFSDSNPNLAIEQDHTETASDMPPHLVIYTSIGLEILLSIVMVLADMLHQNIPTLCHLGATLYANQKTFCQEFWQTPGPMGRLVEAAYSTPVSFWEIMGSLCYNRTSVQRVFEMLPQDYLLESLSSSSKSYKDILGILSAVSKMASFDPAIIRHALNNDPALLFRMLSILPSPDNNDTKNNNNDIVLEQVLNTMSSVMCPSWSMTSIQFFGASSSHDILSRCFGSDKTSTVEAASRMLDALVQAMPVVFFHDENSSHHDNNDKNVEMMLQYLSVVVKASIAACHNLSIMFRFSKNPQDILSYSNAHLILRASSNLLTNLRPIRMLHPNLRLREAATAARDTMLDAFSTSTSFGKALSYFCGAPVSLTMALLLEETIQEAALLELASTDEYAVDDATNPLGAWRAVLKHHSSVSEESSGVSILVQLIRTRLLSIQAVDLAAVHARGWSDSEFGPVHASASAITLLTTWSMELEDFLCSNSPVSSSTDDKNEIMKNASPFRLLSAATTVPPIVEANTSLVHAWLMCPLSTFDLLVYHVTLERLVTFSSLELLSLSVTQAKYCDGGEAWIQKTFSVHGPLYKCMKESIIEAAKSDDPEEDLIAKSILFVKLLSHVLEVNLSTGVALIDHDNSAIGNAMIDAVQTVTDDANNIQDRLGAECLCALRLAKKTNDIHDDLVALATLERDEASIVCTALVVQSLEILAEAIVLKSCNLGKVRELMSRLEFHEEPLVEFRDHVISTCQTMAQLDTVMTTGLSSRVSHPSLLLQAFPSGNTRMLSRQIKLNQYDIQAAATFFYSLNADTVDAERTTATMDQIFMSMMSVKKQVQLVSAWSNLVQVWICENEDSTLSSWNAVADLQSFLTNKMHGLAQLKTTINREVGAIMSIEMEAVFETTSNLLLQLISLGPRGGTFQVDLQKLVETIEIIGPRAGTICSPESMVALNNLLAVATTVVQLPANGIDPTTFVGIIRQSMLGDIGSDIFRSSLLLLATLLHNPGVTEDRRNRIKFANSLEKHGVVTALVDEITKSSANAIKGKDSYDESKVASIQSLMTVLIAIINAGEKESIFLSLFTTSNLNQMLLENPLFAQGIPRWTSDGVDSKYRGYIKSPLKKSKSGGSSTVAVALEGRNDPVHSVWRLGIRLVTSLLRASYIHGHMHDFRPLAFEFVRDYDSALRSCLLMCVNVGHGTVLTHHLVEEADEILVLLSELSTKSDTFLEVVIEVVASFSKFLGSFGMSRFLFQLVRDVEAANQDQDNPYENNLQELHPALAGGVANAKFEAIRHAHHARSAFATVTNEDHQVFAKECGSVPAGNDLETSCYKIINNAFGSAIEAAVANCLTSALTLLSKTHPAARSFIRFTKEESNHLNPFTIVKPGAIIAAHNGDQIQFARVVSSNTVRRSWLCKLVQSGSQIASDEEITISVDTLAGVEDTMKRKVLFQYAPAPDSATELAESRSKPELGHLILALRWCRQQGNGVDPEIRIDLAESTCALLATELALHREIGLDKLVKDAVTKTLCDQLFDLLDKDSKFPGLITCMGPELLQKIRGQLEINLDIARQEREKKRQEYEARLAAMNSPWR